MTKDSTASFPMLLSGALTFRAAGLANSVLWRCANLAEAGHRSVVFVDTIQPTLKREVAALRAAGRLPVSVAVHGILDDLREAAESSPGASPHTWPPASIGYDVQRDALDQNVARYYCEGRYCAFQRWADDGSGSFVDLLVEGRRYQRLMLDSSDQVFAVAHFDSENHLTVQEYVTSAGFVFLALAYRDDKVVDVSVSLGVGSTVRLGSLDELTRFWLERFHRESLAENILISEWAFRKDMLDRLASSLKVRVAYTFHSNHFGYPHRYGSPIKPELRRTVEEIPTMDAVVVLTDAQRDDLRKSFPSLSNIYVIPHVPPRELGFAGMSESRERDPRLAVMVCRLAKGKGIEDAIESFGRVLEFAPDARLEIFGRGPEAGRLEEIIAASGLGASVSLAGFTDSPTEVYQRAGVALFPSLFEGQSLSLLEALRAGCVPVAYDFKYGAREYVQSGQNGFVVDPGNIEELGDATRLLLSDTVLREEMSRRCVEGLDLIDSRRRNVDAWLSLRETLVGGMGEG